MRRLVRLPAVSVFNSWVNGGAELSSGRHLEGSWYPWALASVITQAKPQVCLVLRGLTSSCISAIAMRA